MSTSEASSGVVAAGSGITDEIEAPKPGRSASVVKRASSAWCYVRVRAVAAFAVILTTCTFGVLGGDRVRRWSLRVSLLSASAVPPTPADVVGNYLRGQVLFGQSLTPQMPFRWQTFANRAVITATNAEVPKRIRRLQRLSDLEIRFDTDFDSIVEGCRHGRSGWLTGDVVDLYRQLYELGFVATIGAYREGAIVAGLWGLEIGGTLGIMSVFHRENNSGTLVIAAAVDRLLEGGRWSTIDAGQLHDNYARFGAALISREEFCHLAVRHLESHPA
jgi:leucyl/phenylalanyl-tRNA--protein transferase